MVKFAPDGGFHAELKRRVHQYFQENALSPRGGWRMFVKSGAILLWFASSYVLLVFVASSWWAAGLLALSLVFAMAGAGFAIQHDANHGAYSNRERVNRVVGMTLDMLGGSSYLWYWKHNVHHHTSPNMVGADHDLDVEPFGRLSPDQPRRRYHGLQHFYMWGIYGFMIPKWHFVDDFQNVAQARIGQSRIPRPRGWALVQMIAGKAAFFGWALVVPALFHPIWVVLLFYGATALLLGFILSLVFQLAHCVEEAAFPHLAPGSNRVPEGWAEHQVRTTVDFARGNPLLTWYLGGLNFQVEHHLFPKICHIHYPKMSRIVAAVCSEYGIRYASHERLTGAVSSHWRWLRRMGRPLSAAAAGSIRP
jgi:linoleoyl-CoA desaturase